jgi:hypothetical protein
MPRRCTVCDHPERHGIDGDVIERGRRMPKGSPPGSERNLETRRGPCPWSPGIAATSLHPSSTLCTICGGRRMVGAR